MTASLNIGHTFGQVIATRHPTLYLFSLAIPQVGFLSHGIPPYADNVVQVWAGISFAAFFVYTCIIGWESLNKGPFLKVSKQIIDA